MDEDQANSQGELQVVCPYHDDNVASASINIDSDKFYCHACSRGSHLKYMVKDILGTSMSSLVKSMDISRLDNETTRLGMPANYEELSALYKFNPLVLKQLNVRKIGNYALSLPVMLHDELVDIRNYHPGGQPKWIGEEHTNTGLVVPYDIWSKTNKNDPNQFTLICAGEKDMMIARTYGFNAITITGGEGKLPFDSEWFSGRDIIIAYDNDIAGIKGGKKLANHLLPFAKSVRNLTLHHNVCVNKGEDIYDYFVRYNQTGADLVALINKTKTIDKSAHIPKFYPEVTLAEAVDGENRDKWVKGKIEIYAMNDSEYGVPGLIEQKVGDQTYYFNIRENLNLLVLMLGYKTNTKFRSTIAWEYKVPSNIKLKAKNTKGMEVPPQKILTNETVINFSFIDMVDSAKHLDNNNIKIIETAFVLKDKQEKGKKPLQLSVGKNYEAIYKIIEHPNKEHVLIAVIKSIKPISESYKSFKLTATSTNNLRMFQSINGASIDEKINVLYAMSRHAKMSTNVAHKDIWFLNDLTFHSILYLAYPNTHSKVQIGALDTFVIGDTQTGKSTVTKGLMEWYKHGTFVNLKTTTDKAFIGGTREVGGSKKTVLGLLPRNHGGLLGQEEFQGAPPLIISSLTDTKTSGRLTIDRVAGRLEQQCVVRSLTNSNQRTKGKTIGLVNYPSGIDIVQDLIPANEDIGRIDVFLMVSTPKTYIKRNDTMGAIEPLPQQAYQDRVKWAWSRKATDVVYSIEVQDYIWSEAQRINDVYDASVKLFGAKSDVKLAKLSTALAAMLVSTDSTFTKVIVTKEHVDYIVKWINKIYGKGSLFKLDVYAANEKMYSTITNESIAAAKMIYTTNAEMVEELIHSVVISRADLMSASGLERDAFNRLINTMIKAKLIKSTGRGNYMSTLKLKRSLDAMEGLG